MIELLVLTSGELVELDCTEELVVALIASDAEVDEAGEVADVELLIEAMEPEDVDCRGTAGDKFDEDSAELVFDRTEVVIVRPLSDGREMVELGVACEPESLADGAVVEPVSGPAVNALLAKKEKPEINFLLNVDMLAVKLGRDRLAVLDALDSVLLEANFVVLEPIAPADFVVLIEGTVFIGIKELELDFGELRRLVLFTGRDIDEGQEYMLPDMVRVIAIAPLPDRLCVFEEASNARGEVVDV